MLDVTALLAFAPETPAAAAKVASPTSGDGFFPRLAIHMGKHEDPPGRRVLDDGGHEPVGSLEVGKFSRHFMLTMKGNFCRISGATGDTPVAPDVPHCQDTRRNRRASTHPNQLEGEVSVAVGMTRAGGNSGPTCAFAGRLQRFLRSADGTKQVLRTSP